MTTIRRTSLATAAALLVAAASGVGCSGDSNGTNTGGINTGVGSETGRAQPSSGITPGPGVAEETTRQAPGTGSDATLSGAGAGAPTSTSNTGSGAVGGAGAARAIRAWAARPGRPDDERVFVGWAPPTVFDHAGARSHRIKGGGRCPPYEGRGEEDAMQKPISTRTHGMLDLLTAGALVALPRALGWSDRVTRVLTGAAAGTLGYSLLTRYEWGVIKAVPMRAHLALDAMSGALLCGAPVIFPDEDEGVTGTLAGIGLFEIAASLLTEPEPSAPSPAGTWPARWAGPIPGSGGDSARGSAARRPRRSCDAAGAGGDVETAPRRLEPGGSIGVRGRRPSGGPPGRRATRASGASAAGAPGRAHAPWGRTTCGPARGSPRAARG